MLNLTLAQLNIGVLGGFNLSKADGQNFRSINKIGLQFGTFFTYHFTDHLALQVEPSYNISRIRTNSNSQQLTDGIGKGNKSLDFFALPLLMKITIVPKFAILGGVEYNKLLNTDAHRLNNGENAFKENGEVTYSAGFEISKFYFRYRHLKNFDQIGGINNSRLHQYQFGLRWKLL